MKLIPKATQAVRAGGVPRGGCRYTSAAVAAVVKLTMHTRRFHVLHTTKSCQAEISRLGTQQTCKMHVDITTHRLQ